jgi:hypothetical protein
MKQYFACFGLAMGLTLALSGCAEKKDTGDKVEEAIESAGDKVGGAADNTIDKTEEAARKAKEKVQDAAR